MKKKLFRFGTAVLAAAAVSSTFIFSTVSHSSGNDPLITLSYLTEIVLPRFKSDVLAEVYKNGYTNGNNSFPGTYGDVTGVDINGTYGTSTESSVTVSNADSSYELVELTYGQCLYAKSVVEFIVRPGSDVRAISPFPEQGIADITGAKEYLNGDVVTKNSYCIIPRGGDGRGIQVFNEKSYILVRGEYYIG